jgi:hypothetical protein
LSLPLLIQAHVTDILLQRSKACGIDLGRAVVHRFTLGERGGSPINSSGGSISSAGGGTITRSDRTGNVDPVIAQLASVAQLTIATLNLGNFIGIVLFNGCGFDFMLRTYDRLVTHAFGFGRVLLGSLVRDTLVIPRRANRVVPVPQRERHGCGATDPDQ